MLVIVGYIVVVASVFGGFALAGGHLGALFQPVELLMIGGAAAGAFLVGNNMKAIRATLKALPQTLKGSKYTKDVYMDLMALLYDILAKVRKEGLMTIENDVEEPSVLRLGDGWEVDAELRIDEIALATDLSLPDEDDYDTLAGLILHRLGRFAVPGDVITVELPATLDPAAPTHVRIEVRTLNRHVPERVRLIPHRPDDADGQDDRESEAQP